MIRPTLCPPPDQGDSGQGALETDLPTVVEVGKVSCRAPSVPLPVPPPPRPSMQEMRERFGTLTRDPNFWTFMDELGMEPTEPAPVNVQALPVERLAAPIEGEGRLIVGRFRRAR